MRIRYLVLGTILGAVMIHPVTAPITAVAEGEEAPPLAVLMSCSGDVIVVKTDGTSVRGTFGQPLAAGDEVRTGNDATADVLFENGNYISVGANSSMKVRGTKTQGAEPAKPMGDNGFEVAQNFLKLKSAQGTSSISGLRGSEDWAEKLRAVSPRKTRVIDGRPTFVWEAGEPEEELQLTVYSDAALHWKSTVQGVTEMTYPEDAPALAAGPSYSWKLETTDPLRYPPLASQAAFFEIISDKERGDLETTLKRIEDDGSLSQVSRHIMRASVYFNHGLLANAVGETEVALTAAPEDASLQSILARLYSQVGRMAEAAELYDQILENK
jgi:hypothetical protein